MSSSRNDEGQQTGKEMRSRNTITIVNECFRDGRGKVGGDGGQEESQWIKGTLPSLLAGRYWIRMVSMALRPSLVSLC